MSQYPEHMYFFAEYLIAILLLTFHFKKRSAFLPRAVLCFTLCFLSAWIEITGMSPALVMLRYFVIFLCFLGGMFVCFQITLWDALYLCIAAYAIQHCAYSVFEIFWVLLFPYLNGYAINGYTILSCIYLISYVLEYLLLTRKIKENWNVGANYRTLIVVSTIVMITTLLLHSLRGSLSNDLDPTLGIITSIYSALCCILALFVEFGLSQNNQLMNELNVVNQLWNSDKRQFQNSEANIELINMKCHDLKHQLKALQNDNTSPSNVQALEEIADAIEIYDSTISTNNHALDVILTEKSLYCQKNHITLSCMADGNELNFMRTFDLYSIFGNIIDNAMEAVIKIPDLEKRIIGLTVNRREDFLYIHLENYFNEDDHIHMENGLPLTSKQNNQYHGFGLKSVKFLVEKYNGNVSVKTSQDIFYLNIMIPLR